MTNLAAVVDAHPADAPALLVGADTITYGALRERVARLRGGLVGAGVGVGDRVVLALPNGPDFVASYLAILGLGAVAVPVNPLSPAPERQRELDIVRPRLVVDASVDLAELEGAEPVSAVERADGDLAALVFTSGTVGAPQAAMLTHGNLLANIDQLRRSDPELGPDDVSLGVVPMFHIYGLNVVLGVTLATGGSVALLERFDPAEVAETVRRHGVTVVVGVPAMWSALATSPDVTPDAFARVRLAGSGAAPLIAETRAAVRIALGLELTEGYGLTEASPAVTTCLGIDAPEGSVGVPLPGVSVRLVDPATCEDVLVDDPGEVWVRGPNVFLGYWDAPEATAMALTPDRWLRTGDMAVVDDAGFLYLVDRAKDLIIVSGFNVYPAEVEEVLVTHSAVAEAAVVGTPDLQTGESVHAYVVPADGRTPDPDALIAHCADHLARYKCPTMIEIVDQLPHNLTGKILRRELPHD